MKTVVIGDIHGRNIWKEIIKKETPDRVIFLGDYFDSIEDISPAMQMYNFKEILSTKNFIKEVILLIGNHDYYYFPGIENKGITGFNYGAAPAIGQLLDENKKFLQMCYKLGDILFTHAGVSEVFLKEKGWDETINIKRFINDLWIYKPNSFQFSGWDKYGDNETQTPIWIRPRSLMKGSQNLKKKYIQVVGHTAEDQIDTKGKATGGRYYFIDVLGTSKEYMILNNNNEISFGKIEKTEK